MQSAALIPPVLWLAEITTWLLWGWVGLKITKTSKFIWSEASETTAACQNTQQKDWPDLLLSNRVTDLYCSDTPAAVDQFYAQVFQNYKYFTKFM